MGGGGGVPPRQNERAVGSVGRCFGLARCHCYECWRATILVREQSRAFFKMVYVEQCNGHLQ